MPEWHEYPGGYIDDIILPHDTRKYINRALDLLVNKFVTPGIVKKLRVPDSQSRSWGGFSP
ncbi:hypothetical protein M1N44_02660 [Dehalococcoidia bacterium]|nr:hypothetical protein [Dehalococcoidia bacterium]